VGDDPLDIRQLGVMLQGPHAQSGLLAQLGDSRSIVMRQRSASENRVSYVWIGDQVDLEGLRLEGGLLRLVVLERI